MTWNISTSCTKEEVKAKVTEKAGGFHQHADVAEGINKLVDAVRGEKVSVSGSGYDQATSLSIAVIA